MTPPEPTISVIPATHGRPKLYAFPVCRSGRQASFSRLNSSISFRHFCRQRPSIPRANADAPGNRVLQLRVELQLPQSATRAMDIFITGATGVVGQQVIPVLVDKGHRMVAAARSPANEQALVGMGARPVAVDLFDDDGLRQALAGSDAVISLATHMPSSSIGALLPGAWSENDRIRKL